MPSFTRPPVVSSAPTATSGPAQHFASHRSNNFDFLRFALAALVIFSHSFDMLLGREANPFLRFTRNQLDGGWIAVDGFFILSGYLIAQSFLNSRSVGDYLRRRALRIYPGFLAVAVVSLLFFGPLGMRFSRDYWRYVEPGIFLARLPLLKTFWIPQSFQENHWSVVNGPVWTIQYEFVCYLLVALLGLAGILRRRALVLALFLPIWLFDILQMPLKLWLYNWQELPVGGVPDNYPRFFTCFLAGTLAFLYRDRISFRPLIALLLLAATLALARAGHGLDAILPVSLTYLLLFVAFSPSIPLQRWARYGDFSYGLYLYGWPVQQSLILFCHSWLTPGILFLLSFPTTLLFAIISWHVVERPMLRLKRARRAALPAHPVPTVSQVVQVPATIE
jgi:peptidoglycan/LPS O-acetylase OafA/YrhL